MATLLAKVRIATKTRARTSATNVAGLDTGPMSADHPHPAQLLNQPKHLMDSSILVAMLNQLLSGTSPKLRRPSLVDDTRSFAGAPSVVGEKEPMFLIMSLLTMTPGGLRCRPNANRPQTTERQLQPLRASWMLLRPTMIGRLSDTPADFLGD